MSLDRQITRIVGVWLFAEPHPPTLAEKGPTQAELGAHGADFAERVGDADPYAEARAALVAA